MAATSVATLGLLVFEKASSLRDFGKDWYTASKEWNDFKIAVDDLQRKNRVWEARLTKFGLSSDETLTDSLNAAKSLLDREQNRLNVRKKFACCFEFWPTLLFIAFPGTIGDGLERVIKDYEAIPKWLKDDEELEAQLEKRIQRGPLYTNFREDDRYVSLEKTEHAVRAALENDSGPAVVILCGGPAKGKSTLARHLWRGYKNGKISSTFQQVAYVECGPTADIKDMQRKLLNDLSSSSSLTSEEEIRKLLAGILKDQNVLVILDDIWKEERLDQMVTLFGHGVKCLVTSQEGNLFRGRPSLAVRVPMEDVDQANGRKILASYAGLVDQALPPHIEGVADEIIQSTQGNPLALASIATAIDYDRAEELEEWETAAGDFLRILHYEETAIIYGKKYPRSFWAAMQFSIQSLTGDALNLLMLIHLCEGPSTPEEIIQLLYTTSGLQKQSVSFSRLRKELENRELVKIRSEPADYGFRKTQSSWSVHSLQKLFVKDEMEDPKKLVLATLLDRSNTTSTESKTDMAIVSRTSQEDYDSIRVILCAVYFDVEFARKALSIADCGLEIAGDSLLRSHNHSYIEYKPWLEPLTRLLGQPISDRWPARARGLVCQAIIRYVCDNKLHDGISDLLLLTISVGPMLHALTYMRWGRDRELEVDNILTSPRILEKFVNLLSEDVDPTLRIQVLKVLTFTEEITLRMFHFLGSLDKLVPLLLDKTVDGAASGCIHKIVSIARIARAAKRINQSEIEELLQSKGLLEALLNLTSSGTPRRLFHGELVATLTFIDPTKGNAVKLLSADELILRGDANMILGLNNEALRDFDRAEDDDSVQIFGRRSVVKVRLGDFNGALADLAKYAENYSEDAFILQERGIIRGMMGDLPGALTDLNKALEEDSDDYELLDSDDYEVLKHRGYVKFLMKDDNGARADAEHALRVRPSTVDEFDYGVFFLGGISVEYLGYKLK